MSNEIVGEVDVNIDGREYKLRPSFLGLAEIESRAGAGLLEISQIASTGKLLVKHIVAIIYGGLVGAADDNDEKIPMTYKRLGDVIVREGFTKFADPAMKLLSIGLVGSQKKIKKEQEQDDGA